MTALFADIVGSTGLGERMSPDEVKALVGECVTRMSRVIEEFGGTVQTDRPAVGKKSGLFQAKNAPAPTSCPAF